MKKSLHADDFTKLIMANMFAKKGEKKLLINQIKLYDLYQNSEMVSYQNFY